MSRANVTVVVVVAGALLGGCVERQLVITSEPSGALVYMADEEIGRTPLSVPFTWYGDRELILRLDGHETLRTKMTIHPPLYDIPPWDFVSQALVPWTYHYRVDRFYELQPRLAPTDEELVRRAEGLRESGFGDR